ncbi:MAG: succinylglutamate desuccinylase/aspartoacylase family protein [Candidatus Gracilibacteria bacterium]|nr:succinylglutamate desuccinylase/aspartoacylase family protein [Candidatus Gracilibacteria bacterium]
METIMITGKKAGPTLAIIGGTHGNEVCGIRLLDFLKDNLTIKSGKVILIYGNPEAIAKGVRQVGMNLNRAFLEDEKLDSTQKGTYEYRRSRDIMEILKECDYSLDIHSSPTIGSKPMIICENNAIEIASYFPFDIRCEGFDEIDPGSTEYFINSIGKVGIGIECGYHEDPIASIRAKECTFALLSSLGMIDFPKKKYVQKQFIANAKYITKTDDFKIARFFDDFEPIKSGELIGSDGGNPVYSKDGGYILFARDRNEIGVEGFVEIIDGDF